MDAEQRRAKKAEYMRRWRAAHPENRNYQRAYNARYFSGPDRQRANRERARDWYAANPEQGKQRAAASYERDKERAYAKSREWIARNPEKWRLYQHVYQAKRRALKASATIGEVDYAAILAKANGACCLCGAPLGDKWHFDHIVALARGGPHSQDNLQAVHPTCNRRKNARTEWEHLFLSSESSE